MDLNAIIENMETGDQDAALVALQTYNKKMTQCFSFTSDQEEEREDEGKFQERLGALAMGFLERDLQPSCQLACLETIRILSRDKNNVAPFITQTAMLTLSRHAGIAHGDGNVPAAENPDLEIIVEALKSICNICLHNKVAVGVAQELQLIVGIAGRLKQCGEDQWNHHVRFFDLRLMFLLTAQRVEMRTQLLKELRGVSLLSDHLDATLWLCWPDTFEVARAGVEVDPDSDLPVRLPPFSREKIERAMEILKILFNITYDANRREVDEEEAAAFRHLGAILRHCLMSSADGEDYTEEFHSHSLNLLGNLPLTCLDVLLMPKVQQGSIEYMGVNMDAVNMLLEYMEKMLDRGKKLKETMLPSLNLLTESARIHRETRKFLRMKVLPPLRDVKNLPEVGEAIRNKLVRLMTNIDTDIKNCAAEFLFVLCKESVSRFIKYTGYGNAAGLLAARGLLRGGINPGIYSEDEDSETEEYREAKAKINPVTGRVEDEQPNPMEGMTEEQKELEAMKLVNMFDKLSRSNIIQPMTLGSDGSMTQMNSEDLIRMRDQIPLGQLNIRQRDDNEEQEEDDEQEEEEEQQQHRRQQQIQEDNAIKTPQQEEPQRQQSQEQHKEEQQETQHQHKEQEDEQEEQ